MNDDPRHPANLANSHLSDRSTRQASLRDRWEDVRYGPKGRVLGYVLIFTLVFVSIFLFLLFLERGHF